MSNFINKLLSIFIPRIICFLKILFPTLFEVLLFPEWLVTQGHSRMKSIKETENAHGVVVGCLEALQKKKSTPHIPPPSGLEIPTQLTYHHRTRMEVAFSAVTSPYEKPDQFPHLLHQASDKSLITRDDGVKHRAGTLGSTRWRSNKYQILLLLLPPLSPSPATVVLIWCL